MQNTKEKKEKKISIGLRAKAFRYLMPYYTEPELIHMVKATPAVTEREVIEILWSEKKQYSPEETIYKDWCEGMDYTALQKKYHVSRRRILNALNDTRQEIINVIFERFAGETYGGTAETEPEKKRIRLPKRSEQELFDDFIKLCREIQQGAD